MTTIAWDGKTLAVDSRATSDRTIVTDKCQKMFLGVAEYAAVVICGDEHDGRSFVEWLSSGGDMPKGEECSLIAVTKSGKAYRYISSSKIAHKIKAPYADGSGWIIALASMDAGLCAVDAVKAAKKRDVYTGGRVVYYCIEEEE